MSADLNTGPPTRVVNVKTSDFDVYIGRANLGRRLSQSVWANPFPIDSQTTRDQAIELFRKHLENHPELLSRVHELKGKRLGCWCKPKACHGDLLAKLADGKPLDVAQPNQATLF